MKYIIPVMVVSTVLLTSCREKEPDTPQSQAPQAHSAPQIQQAHTQAPPSAHTAVVEQVIQGDSYTYLQLKEGDSSYWIATSLMEMEVGKTVTFSNALEMNNFTSKELDRTFDTIYFVSNIGGASSAASPAPAAMPTHQIKPVATSAEISVEPAPGGITIAELFANRDDYAGKTVTIRGQVTKVNRAIMGKNWVHLQDGTSHESDFDLTVTTLEEANVGEVVTLQGKIALNRDFGSGYSYEVIMEEAARATE